MGADVEAIEQVYRRHFAQFVRVAAAIGPDPDGAADIVHDAFAAAIHHRDDYRGAGSLEGWLWRAVVNTARSHARRERRWLRRLRALGPRDAGFAAAEPGDPRVRALVAGLPSRQRHVLFLRYYAGLDYAQIAEALRIRTGTVSATLNHAHAALRKQIENEDRDDREPA